MKGTYVTKDERDQTHVICNLNSDLQLQLTPKQELNLYKRGHREEGSKVEEEI